MGSIRTHELSDEDKLALRKAIQIERTARELSKPFLRLYERQHSAIKEKLKQGVDEMEGEFGMRGVTPAEKISPSPL